MNTIHVLADINILIHDSARLLFNRLYIESHPYTQDTNKLLNNYVLVQLDNKQYALPQKI